MVAGGLMRRMLFDEDHELFRRSFEAFLVRNVVPNYAQWERDGIVDREVWTEAGRQGFLGLGIPEQFGGLGTQDFRYNAIVGEEINRKTLRGLGFTLHNDIVIPYLMNLGTPEQKSRWLPGMVTGEKVAAIAMTEPGAGSDLTGIRTTAARLKDENGEFFLVNGSKTFITNGQHADIVLVAVRTAEDRHHGLSLLVLERGMSGFTRGANLDKIGMHAQDTSELFFDDVRVPVSNLLGEENRGFYYLVTNLPQERLSISVGAVVVAESALEQTLEYVKKRSAFGHPIGEFQHSRFLLADLATEIRIARVFVDNCLESHIKGELTAVEAAMAKMWTTELQVKVVDRCLQLHGGYGYMNEMTIARTWRDSRAQTIYGGSSEIMKEIIGRNLGL
jgi:alkylation response protein AidB-like acyl-CoA dehydrogenase